MTLTGRQQSAIDRACGGLAATAALFTVWLICGGELNVGAFVGLAVVEVWSLWRNRRPGTAQQAARLHQTETRERGLG